MKKLASLTLAVALFVSAIGTTVSYGEEVLASNTITVYHSRIKEGNDSNSFQKMSDVHFQTNMLWDHQNTFTVLPQEKDQVMAGIGASMSETSAYVLHQLPENKREEVFNRFFSEDQAAYSIMRTPIGSSDFSTHEYDYAPDKEQSIATNLENFSVAEDEVHLIPAIQKALTYQPNLKIFSAPWAPPAWMKVSGDRLGDGLINAGSITTKPNHMDPQYYNLYAKYLVKYIQEYKKRGIPIYSLSLQNETQNNPDWESLYWSQDQAQLFIRDFLGPQLEAEGFGDIKLLIWDWDRQEGAIGKGDGFLTFNRNMLRSDAAQYIDGVAFHWYGPLDITKNYDYKNDFRNVETLHKEFPNTLLYATEAAQSLGTFAAYNFLWDIINDIRAGANGWMAWNIVVDHKGGPIWKVKQNAALTSIQVNTDTKEYVINPEYYMMKHFSRTIRPGDIKIRSDYADDRFKNKGELQQVAFLDKETGKVKLIVANVSTETKKFVIREGGRVAPIEIPADTMATYEFTPGVVVNYEVALQKIASSSSFENNPTHDYHPYQAFDTSKYYTRWASVWNSDKEWIQVDLGLDMAISGVDMIWSWGWKNEYSIQVSKDGVNWIPVTTIDGTASLVNTTGVKYPMTINFSPINGRYVRMQGIKNKQGYGYSIYDMKVSASGENANLDIIDTKAINKPSTASSYEGNPTYNYRPESAFDTDPNSRWASGWDNPDEWIQVDLGSPEKIAGVLLNWEWGWKNIYEIQTSMDGVNWTTATRVDGTPQGSGTSWNNPKGNRRIMRMYFEPSEGRYVRMQGVQKKQQYGYSLYDFKVYTLR